MTTKTDSPAIAAAKAAANDTDFIRKYGPDDTYWTHFIDWRIATAADWTTAIELIETRQPEAINFLDHLRSMRDICLTAESAKREDAIANTERALKSSFAKRDRLMSADVRDWAAIERQESFCADWQLELAALVEATDPARAQRLRDMAASRRVQS